MRRRRPGWASHRLNEHFAKSEDKILKHLREFVLVASIAGLAGCATQHATGVMAPVAIPPDAGVRQVNLLVATTRQPAAMATQLFSGERGREMSYAEISVSVPPGHQAGQIEWPKKAAGDPRQHFVTASVRGVEKSEFTKALRKQIAERASAARPGVHPRL